MPAFGRDENHSGSSSRAIDGRGRGIFQYVDALNIIGSHGRQASFNAVDKHKGGVSTAQRDDTTQPDARGNTRITRLIGNCQTRNLAFDKVAGILDVALDEVIRLHTRYGRGNIAFALRAVTNDYNILEDLGIFLKRDVHSFAGNLFLRRKTNVRNHEEHSSSHPKREIAVNIGNGAIARITLFHNAGTHHRVAVVIFHHTFDGDFILLFYGHGDSFRGCPRRKRLLSDRSGQQQANRCLNKRMTMQ